MTLLHSQTTLLTPNVYKENLYRRLNEGLERLNVKVILDDRVLLMNNLPSNFIEGKQHFVTEKKKIPIESDLTFICIGAFVNNKSIENGPLKSKLNIETRRLNVNEFLQVEGFENIFAVGDIAEKEDKLAYIAGEQGTYVGKFISQLEQKKKKIEPYRGREQKLIVLSIGRNSGAAQLPFAGTTVLGEKFVVRILFPREKVLGKIVRNNLSRSIHFFSSDDNFLQIENDEERKKFIFQRFE